MVRESHVRSKNVDTPPPYGDRYLHIQVGQPKVKESNSELIQPVTGLDQAMTCVEVVFDDELGHADQQEGVQGSD
jgi:hypothetical protein